MFSQILGVHNIVLTAQDSSGCSDTIQLSVMVNALPIISVSSTPATCNTCMDGEALVTVLSGPTPHLVVWSVGRTSNPIVGLNPGDYGVTLTDGNMCSFSDSVTVVNSVGVHLELENSLLYPNPSNKQLLIQGVSGNCMVHVFDNTGKLFNSFFKNRYRCNNMEKRECTLSELIVKINLSYSSSLKINYIFNSFVY